MEEEVIFEVCFHQALRDISLPPRSNERRCGQESAVTELAGSKDAEWQRAPLYRDSRLRYP